MKEVISTRLNLGEVRAEIEVWKVGVGDGVEGLTSLSSSPTTSSSISLPSNPSSGTSIVYLWFLETLIFAEGGEETLDKSDTKEESDPVEGVERWRGGEVFSSSNDFTTFS